MENIKTAEDWLKEHEWDKKYTNVHFQDILTIIELAKKSGFNEGVSQALYMAAEKAETSQYFSTLEGEESYWLVDEDSILSLKSKLIKE